MTVTRLYYCDLCGASGNGEPLRGLYWKHTGTREGLIQKPVKEVEHHICEKCLADLKKLPDSQSDASADAK